MDIKPPTLFRKYNIWTSYDRKMEAASSSRNVCN